MATVDSEVKCRCCRFPEAYSEFNTRRYTESIFCSRCGRCEYYVFDTGYRERSGGFGTYRIEHKKGVSRTGSFSKRRSLKTRIKSMAKAVASRHYKQVEITAREKGKWKTIVLKGKPARTRILDRHYPLYQAPTEYALDWSMPPELAPATTTPTVSRIEDFMSDLIPF